MKKVRLQELYQALAIDEKDVKTFRQLTTNQILIIFRDGHEAIFKLEPRRIIKSIVLRHKKRSLHHRNQTPGCPVAPSSFSVGLFGDELLARQLLSSREGS